MKKSLPFCAFLCAFHWLGAQITVTNAAFPAAGDTLKTATALFPQGITITPPGGNQQWDFSGLEAVATQQLVYRPAAEGSVPVPGAELFAALGGGTAEGYFNVKATAFELLAIQGPAPAGLNIPTLMNFAPPLTERRAPMNFFDINQISSSLLLPFSTDIIPGIILQSFPVVPDSIRLRIAISRLDVVDAWGMLAIPGGTYPVLREKRTEYKETRLDAKIPILGWLDVTDVLLNNPAISSLGTDTTLTYNFFSNQAKEVIAVVTMDKQQQNVLRVVFKDNGPVSGSKDLESNKPTVSVSPNPVAGAATFELENFPSGSYTLQLFSTAGLRLKEKQFTIAGRQTELFDTSTFAPGSYFYRLLDKNGKRVSSGKWLKL